MTHRGSFIDVVRYIDFVVYDDLSIYTTGEIKRESLFGIVSNDEVLLAIHKEIEKVSAEAPMYKSFDDKELFNQEFGQANEQPI